MQVCLVIEKMFPEANSSNYGVTVFGDGHWEITKWELNVPQPTLDELQAQWDVMNLADLKQNKLNELNDSCNNAILNKFTSQVDGVTYSFSNDDAAQSNFKDAKLAWMDGDLQPTDTLKWTAYDQTGAVVRIPLTKAQFDPINLARIMWQQSNVSKLRDTLEPLVVSATNPDDIAKIVW